jgi:3-methyladenine DNA glycosylase Mpg
MMTGEMSKVSEALGALMPDPSAADRDYLPAFRAIADLLLNRVTLVVAGTPHRLTEVEFYYHGGSHRDDFTHRDPMQSQSGTWYFHRAGGEYKHGTFKGLDITIGRSGAHGGILIRSVERLDPEQKLFDGPSVVVDHLLALTQSPRVKDLASRFDLRIDPPEEPDASPLYMTLNEESHGKFLCESPRVGLTLKKGDFASRKRFIARPYRFLSEPIRIRKGKTQLVVALHHRGVPAPMIAWLTRSTPATIESYIDFYERGVGRSPAMFPGDLPPAELCQLLGACRAEMG